MNKTHRFHTFYIVIIGLFFISSCDLIDSLKKDKNEDENGDEDRVEFVDGISRDILEFVTQEDLDILEDTLDIQIHRGNNPPNLNGSYKVSPVLLKKTNIANDFEIGSRFADKYLKFYDQNDVLFTIEVDNVNTHAESGEVLGEGIGRGSFLVGNGSSFSIFSKTTHTQSSGEEAELLYLYSGTLENDGIRNFEYALLMLNNNGHDTVFIKNQTGRSFYDEDSFSESAPFPAIKSADLFRNGFIPESVLSPNIRN